MWCSSLPLSLFSRLSLFIAILSHLLGLLGTACLRSARFARFARSRASRARHLGPSWARLGLPKPSQDSSMTPKIAFWKRLGASRARLGPSWRRLGPSWAVLGRLGAVLGRLGAYLVRLGAILGRLGAILAHLGAILGRLGRVLASQKPPKIAPRRLLRYEKIAVARVWRFRGVTGSTFFIIFHKKSIIENPWKIRTKKPKTWKTSSQ